MAGFWAAAAALIAVTGTVFGVVITQQSERSRQGEARRFSEARRGRDRRLEAYECFVRSVSLRVSALSELRDNANIAGEYWTAKAKADEALAEMWIALRCVRLVGPEEVARLAEKVTWHYKHIDGAGFPERGTGANVEEDLVAQLVRLSTYPNTKQRDL